MQPAPGSWVAASSYSMSDLSRRPLQPAVDCPTRRSLRVCLCYTVCARWVRPAAVQVPECTSRSFVRGSSGRRRDGRYSKTSPATVQTDGFTLSLEGACLE